MGIKTVITGADCSPDKHDRGNAQGQAERPAKRDIVKNPPSQIPQYGQDRFISSQPRNKQKIV